jgi:hypothetical protein
LYALVHWQAAPMERFKCDDVEPVRSTINATQRMDDATTMYSSLIKSFLPQLNKLPIVSVTRSRSTP